MYNSSSSSGASEEQGKPNSKYSYVSHCQAKPKGVEGFEIHQPKFVYSSIMLIIFKIFTKSAHYVEFLPKIKEGK